MSLVSTNAQSPFEEVVPASVAVKGVSRSSILVQRRRVRAPPQTGTNYGSAGAGGGNRQLQFVIADAAGLLDPSSVTIMYNVQTSGAGSVCTDEGHPFGRMQLNLNGQNLEDIQQAARNTNAEVKLGCGQNWYRNEGSFCGYELCNNELAVGARPAINGAVLAAYSPAWADTVNNQAAVASRQAANAYPWNPLGGESRIMPLGLLSGVGRMKQYLPLNVLGELNLTLFTLAPNEALIQAGGTNGDYSLSGVFLEYDIVVPVPQYAELLSKIANDSGDMGLMMPFESTITATSGTIGVSGSLSESSIIVSRATQNLLRSYLIQQPTAAVQSLQFPSQSCFGHAGTFSIQFRVGSQYYPAIPAEGDASLYAMTMLAYGTAARNDNGSVISRVLWGQFTSVAGAAGAYTPTTSANEGADKFAGADSFIPCYGFQNVKGRAEALDVDGISLAGASGSQCVVVVRSAPSVQVTPVVGLVALRFLSAQSGAVRVLGA